MLRIIYYVLQYNTGEYVKVDAFGFPVKINNVRFATHWESGGMAVEYASHFANIVDKPLILEVTHKFINR